MSTFDDALAITSIGSFCLIGVINLGFNSVIFFGRFFLVVLDPFLFFGLPPLLFFLTFWAEPFFVIVVGEAYDFRI